MLVVEIDLLFTDVWKVLGNPADYPIVNDIFAKLKASIYALISSLSAFNKSIPPPLAVLITGVENQIISIIVTLRNGLTPILAGGNPSDAKDSVSRNYLN